MLPSGLLCLDTEYAKCLDDASRMYDNVSRQTEVIMPPVRGTKREAIRVEPELWREYGLACEAIGANRSADIRAHMQRRVRAWKRKGSPARAAPS